ncbi:MAG: hypothetical protein WA217_23995 [Candidatus Binatus sp.]
MYSVVAKSLAFPKLEFTSGSLDLGIENFGMAKPKASITQSYFITVSYWSGTELSDVDVVVWSEGFVTPLTVQSYHDRFSRNGATMEVDLLYRG